MITGKDRVPKSSFWFDPFRDDSLVMYELLVKSTIYLRRRGFPNEAGTFRAGSGNFMEGANPPS